LHTENKGEPIKEASFTGKILLSFFLFIFFAMGTSFFSFMGYSLFREISSYLWDKTECTIISSRIEEGNKSGHSIYSFKAVYSYSKKGRDYKAEKISLQYGGSSRYNDAQELLNKFPAGAKGICHVNPSNNAEAILSHNYSQLLMFPFLAIPVIFIVIGGGGIYAIWSRKNLSDIVKKNTAGTGGKIPNLLLSLFFTAFLLIGLAASYSIGFRPAVKLLQSEKWQETPCRIISSSVGSHDGEDGTTYSVDILYSYDINGREFRSNTYSFMGGSSSGYKGKQKIARAYQPGMNTFCYVNPENHTDAVLNRKFTADMLFGLIPLIFVIVGAGGLYYVLKRKDGPDGNPAEFDSRSLSDYSEGDCELKPVSGPWGSFFGGLIFTLFWNGIVSIFVYQDVQGWIKGRPDWFLTIFLTPFVIIGLLCIYGSLSAFIALFNPRPRIRVNSKSIYAGNKLKVQWEINEKSTELFRKLTITLKCIRGEYRAGNSRKNIVESFAVVETEDSFKMASGSKDIVIPENAFPTNDSSGDGKICWIITLNGTLRSRPKIDLEYRMRVLGNGTK
jgi:hypothetical protein